MIPADITDLARHALLLVVALSLPFVGAALTASILVGALQRFTRLSEPAVTQVARIAAVLACALAAAPWMAHEAKRFAETAFRLIHDVVR